MPLRFTIQELSKYVEEIFPQVKDDFEIPGNFRIWITS